MNDRTIIIAGLIALACICAIAALDRGPAIQRAVRAQAEEVLQDRRLQMRVDGRIVSLSGTVSSDSEKVALTGRLEALRSVQKVHNRVFVVTPESFVTSAESTPVDYRYALTVRDMGDRVWVDGNVPNELSRERIMTIVYTASIGKEVSSDELKVAGVDSPRAAAWDEAARKSLQVAVALERLSFDLADEVLSVEGLAEDDAHRATVLSELSPFGGQKRFQIAVGMSGTDLCQNQIYQLTNQDAITFDQEHANLSPVGGQTLDRILDVLWQCPSAPIEIVDLNTRIESEQRQRRAEAVRNYLITAGILATRLSKERFADTDSGGSPEAIVIHLGERRS